MKARLNAKKTRHSTAQAQAKQLSSRFAAGCCKRGKALPFGGIPKQADSKIKRI